MSDEKPVVEQCGERDPFTVHGPCTRERGHDGDHQNAVVWWRGRICGVVDGDRRCVMTEGHSAPHVFNGALPLTAPPTGTQAFYMPEMLMAAMEGKPLQSTSPAPWHWDVDESKGRGEVLLDANGEVVVGYDGYGMQVRDADQRLTAAAPELLAVLRESLGRPELDLRERARRLIARIDGTTIPLLDCLRAVREFMADSEKGPPYDYPHVIARLMAKFPDVPEDVVYEQMEMLTLEGFIDYGVSVRVPWLTEKGEQALAKAEGAATEQR